VRVARISHCKPTSGYWADFRSVRLRSRPVIQKKNRYAVRSTTPPSAMHSVAGTCQRFAAASTSMMRAAAPARDSVSNVQFTLQLPPVSMSPYFGSLVG